MTFYTKLLDCNFCELKLFNHISHFLWNCKNVKIWNKFKFTQCGNQQIEEQTRTCWLFRMSGSSSLFLSLFLFFSLSLSLDSSGGSFPPSSFILWRVQVTSQAKIFNLPFLPNPAWLWDPPLQAQRQCFKKSSLVHFVLWGLISIFHPKIPSHRISPSATN